jgi:flagellar hook-basal body complex protein FliE
MELRPHSSFDRHTQSVWDAMRRVAEHENASNGIVAKETPFAELFHQGIAQVHQTESSAKAKIEQLLSGDDVNQAEVFTSIQKADMSFRMLVQIRNKLLQAFEELNAIRV